MSPRVHRILVVCAALVGCDAPAAEPAPAPAAEVVAPAVTPPTKETPPATASPPPTSEPIAPAEPTSPPTSSTPPRATAELKQAAGRSINELTIDLQRKLARQPGNLLVSAASLSVALAAVHAGSGGATARELAGALNLDRPAAELYPAFAGLAARWGRRDGHVTFVHASRLFGEQKFGFKPEYLDLTRTVFAAPLEPLDFLGDAAGARGRINAAIGEHTDARIDEVWPEGTIDGKTRLVVADAVHFEADWLEPFDPAATAPQMFFGVEHKRQVPMMRSVQRLRVAPGMSGKLRMIELPYKGDEYSLVILLPLTRDGLKAVEKQFDFERLQSWIDAAKPIPVELRLPRFTLDSNLDLAPALQKLGAARIFDPRRAELGGMASEKKLALSGVRQRARFVVEERGADAGAATAIEISVGGAPATPTPLVVDRPFLFYVRDVRTGVLLFFGRVTDPE